MDLTCVWLTRWFNCSPQRKIHGKDACFPLLKWKLHCWSHAHGWIAVEMFSGSGSDFCHCFCCWWDPQYLRDTYVSAGCSWCIQWSSSSQSLPKLWSCPLWSVWSCFPGTSHSRVVIVAYNAPWSSSCFIPDRALFPASLVTTSIHFLQAVELWLVDRAVLPIEN